MLEMQAEEDDASESTPLKQVETELQTRTNEVHQTHACWYICAALCFTAHFIVDYVIEPKCTVLKCSMFTLCSVNTLIVDIILLLIGLIASLKIMSLYMYFLFIPFFITTLYLRFGFFLCMPYASPPQNFADTVAMDSFRILEERNITYFLGAGSAIGVIRYEDILPWEHDIDIFFDRSTMVTGEEMAQIVADNSKYDVIAEHKYVRIKEELSFLAIDLWDDFVIREEDRVRCTFRNRETFCPKNLNEHFRKMYSSEYDTTRILDILQNPYIDDRDEDTVVKPFRKKLCPIYMRKYLKKIPLEDLHLAGMVFD